MSGQLSLGCFSASDWALLWCACFVVVGWGWWPGGTTTSRAAAGGGGGGDSTDLP